MKFLCFLSMMQNVDGNIFLHEHYNRLNNAVGAKTTFTACKPRNEAYISHFFLHTELSKRYIVASILGHACGNMKAVGLNHTKAKPITGPEGSGNAVPCPALSKQDSRCCKLEQSLVTYTLNFNCFFSPSHL